MAASSFYLATTVEGAAIGYSMILITSGAGGVPGGCPEPEGPPITGQLWPRGDHTIGSS